jgi:hypothetical protein
VLEHESERQVFFQSETTVFQRAWLGQALLGVEDDRSDTPVIFRIDREGRTERADFTFAGARYISIIRLAGSADGTVAVIGAAAGGTPRGFLARISQDRTRQVVVQLRRFLAKAVTIWTLGWVWDGETVSQNNVMERFDSSGKLVGTAVSVRHARAMVRAEPRCDREFDTKVLDRPGGLADECERVYRVRFEWARVRPVSTSARTGASGVRIHARTG